VVINPHYTRGILYDDSIVRVSSASYKIGSEGSPESHAKWKRDLFTDRYYTQLIPQSPDTLFEFLRNKEYCENLLEENADIQKPTLNLPENLEYSSLTPNRVVIFPGAGHSGRQWHIDNFIEICRFITANSQYELIISGSAKETLLAKYIADALDKRPVTNLTGQTSLVELALIIKNSRLLISNETGAIHLAAAVDTPFICFSNGKGFGRFHPYPPQIYNKGIYLYPPEIMNNLENDEELKRKYNYESDLNINDISVELVQSVVKKILQI
jgi:ADP-heptose:LPS heptosyltransferase